MSAVARLTKPAAGVLAAAGAVYLLQGLVCRPSWRANVAWLVHSWWRPAGREARWQQAIGDPVDPWDRGFRGRGSHGSERETQPASSIGR